MLTRLYSKLMEASPKILQARNASINWSLSLFCRSPAPNFKLLSFVQFPSRRRRETSSTSCVAAWWKKAKDMLNVSRSVDSGCILGIWFCRFFNGFVSLFFEQTFCQKAWEATFGFHLALSNTSLYLHSVLIWRIFDPVFARKTSKYKTKCFTDGLNNHWSDFAKASTERSYFRTLLLVNPLVQTAPSSYLNSSGPSRHRPVSSRA